MPRTISIGNQTFSSLIENNNFYVDKTSFIKEWWEGASTVTLITRPRRFGKTLNMNMLALISSFYQSRIIEHISDNRTNIMSEKPSYAS